MTTMDDPLWQQLPTGLLKRGYQGFSRLEPDLQPVIVELAKEQKFKCFFCDAAHNLIVEHDHYPEQGRGDHPTIHNVRGLVCQRCNWHLGLYEADERGEDRRWDHVYVKISEEEYDKYSYAYEIRLRRLHEDHLKKTCPNYWDRRAHLDKFDDWNEWHAPYPWTWCFEEIKEKRHGKIRTPEQFFEYLSASVQFVAAELKKDPNYQPPEEFIKLIFGLKPFFDNLKPILEARMKERGITWEMVRATT
jgi:hypothetical protein